MDYNKAFTFIFNDPDWVKKTLIFIVMMVLGIFLIPALIAAGYVVKTMRSVSSGSDSLPEWEDWGDLLGIGFKVFVIGLIAALPIIILSIIFGASVVMSLVSRASRLESALPVFGVGTMLGLLLILAYSLVLLCVGPAILMQFAKTDSIGAAFDFSDVSKLITENLNNYAIAVGIYIGLTIASSMVSGATYSLGVFVAVPYTYLVTAHLFGQILASPAVTADAADVSV